MKTKHLVQILIANFVFLFGGFWLLSFIARQFSLNYTNFSWYIGYIIIGALILLIYKFMNKEKFSDYGIKKISFKDFKIAIYFLFLLFPIAFIARLIDPSFDLWFAQNNNMLSLAGLFWLVAIMPLSVLYEELFMRSLIQSKFSKIYNTLITIIFLSINFAIAHFYLKSNGLNHVIATVIAVFFGSLILVAVFEITKNLFVSFITHLFYNIIILLQIYLHATKQTFPEILFWVIFGVLFLLSIKKALPYIKSLNLQFRKVSILNWIYIIGLTIILPVLIILISTIK